MSIKMDRKTIAIIAGILIFLFLAVFFGMHILWPALDPVMIDMTKIFFCGLACGLLAGFWLGRRFEREVQKKEH